MRRPLLLQSLIAVALVAAIALPVLYGGWRASRSASEAEVAGRYTEAAASYERAARLLPWRPDLLQRAGLSAYRGNDIPGAVRLLELARSGEPLSVDGYAALGSALWTQGGASAALAAWTEGLQKYPNAPALLDRLIAVYDYQGDYAAEKEAIINRLAAGNYAPANYRLGLLLMTADANASLGQLRTAARLDPTYSPAAGTLEAALQVANLEPTMGGRLVVIGRGLGLVGEWHLAVKSFQQATASDPSNTEAWAWLGESLQQTGADGRPALDRALSLDPNDSVVHALRALYWRRQQNYQSALVEQIQAAKLDPQNASLQSAVGDAYVAAGDLVSALAAYQEATVIAPNDAAAWRQLASFSAENGVQVHEVGLPAALKASSLAPHDALTLDVLGWTYTQAGSPFTGRQSLLKAIAADPGLAIAYLHLAETDLRIGDSAAAASALQKATDLDPDGAVGQAARQLLDQYTP